MSVVATTPAAIAAALGLDRAFESSSKHDDDIGDDVDHIDDDDDGDLD
jgi:hypothetical protein